MTFATIVFGGMLYCLCVAWICCTLWELMSFPKGGDDGKD